MQSLLTMTNIYDPVNLKQIEVAADDLLRCLRGGRTVGGESPSSLDEKHEYIKNEDITDSENDIGDVEICLAKKEEDNGEEVIAYYLSSMAEQAVFWLEDGDTSLVTGYERAVISNSHLGELK